VGSEECGTPHHIDNRKLHHQNKASHLGYVFAVIWNNPPSASSSAPFASITSKYII
jgi:hypothetical protein